MEGELRKTVRTQGGHRVYFKRRCYRRPCYHKPSYKPVIIVAGTPCPRSDASASTLTSPSCVSGRLDVLHMLSSGIGVPSAWADRSCWRYGHMSPVGCRDIEPVVETKNGIGRAACRARARRSTGSTTAAVGRLCSKRLPWE